MCKESRRDETWVTGLCKNSFLVFTQPRKANTKLSRAPAGRQICRPAGALLRRAHLGPWASAHGYRYIVPPGLFVHKRMC
jgi:hypothetical protein